jgi:hypothetical protein
MKLVSDFFNKAVQAIDKKYFAEVKYYRDNDRCAKVHHTFELFNNGCLTYDKLISRVAQSCMATKEDIHEIVKPFVVDWMGYEYKVK